jgi:hypothetical protein
LYFHLFAAFLALRLVDFTVEQLMVSGVAFILNRLRGQELSFSGNQIYHQHSSGEADEPWDPWGLNAGEQLLPLAQIKVGEEAEGGCDWTWLGFEGPGGGFPTLLADFEEILKYGSELSEHIKSPCSKAEVLQFSFTLVL